mgnify:CR=1 FL=1
MSAKRAEWAGSGPCRPAGQLVVGGFAALALQHPAVGAHQHAERQAAAGIAQAALELLGPDFTWTNRVYVDGPVTDGVLDGNLIIRGSGDPKLVLERVDALLRQVMAQGVREVRGDIVLDRSIFQVPERHPGAFDDEPLRPYNASPDGLLVNFKSLVFTFTPDPAHSQALIRSEPPIAGVEIPASLALVSGPCGDWRAGLRADFSSPDRVRFAAVSLDEADALHLAQEQLLASPGRAADG